MWIPYNLLSPLKAESPKATITASEADASERAFVVGFFLRNPATRAWECDILVPAGDEKRKIDIAGRQAALQLSANSTGKLEQIIYTLPATTAAAALAACYGHVTQQLDGMIVQYGRGIEIAGWQIADVAHDARWRCVPFRPSSLMPSPGLRDVPHAYHDVLRLYREARCTASARWRLICAGAILDAAVAGRPPFEAKAGAPVHARTVVTADRLVRSGVLAFCPDLEGATLKAVHDRIEPQRQALLAAMGSPGEAEVRPQPAAAVYESEAALAALANLADLLARDVVVDSLREGGYLAPAPEAGRETFESAAQSAGMN